MYRQLRQLLDKSEYARQAKWDIVDNIDNLSKYEQTKILYFFEKKFGKFEKWLLLRAVFKITKSQDRVGE